MARQRVQWQRNWEGCAKIPFTCRRDAQRACQSLRRRRRDPGLGTYYCRLCAAFHVGHKRGTGRNRNF